MISGNFEVQTFQRRKRASIAAGFILVHVDVFDPNFDVKLVHGREMELRSLCSNVPDFLH